MTDPSNAIPFEQALAELDAIVRELEEGQTGLEQALARYEQGVSLLKHCYGQLRDAEQRIVLLSGEDDQGRPVTSLFEHVATLEPALSEPLRKRRKPAGGASP